MPNARCRVFENGKLVNIPSPYADGGGAVAVKVSPRTLALDVEWAPAELPQTARYPFRKRYHLDMGWTQDEGVACRLHNIGFSACSTLEDNIIDFQVAYNNPQTGKSRDVEGELLGFHDAALLPPVPPVSNVVAQAAPRQQLVGASASPVVQPRLPAAGSSGAGAPAARPGVQDQGSVTGVQTTKVNIELHMAFSLDPNDFDLLDVQWKGVPYDVQDLLTKLYPTKMAMTWRLGRGGHQVVGAVLAVDGRSASEQPKPTDAGGKTTLKLFVPNSGNRFITIHVEPPAGQKNETGPPAGPGLTDKDARNKFLFRPFTLMLAVDDTGALIEPLCGVFTADSEPEPGREVARVCPIDRGCKAAEKR